MLRFFKNNFFPIDKIDKNEKPKPKYISEKQTININLSYGTFMKE